MLQLPASWLLPLSPGTSTHGKLLSWGLPMRNSHLEHMRVISCLLLISFQGTGLLTNSLVFAVVISSVFAEPPSVRHTFSRSSPIPLSFEEEKLKGKWSSNLTSCTFKSKNKKNQKPKTSISHPKQELGGHSNPAMIHDRALFINNQTNKVVLALNP